MVKKLLTFFFGICLMAGAATAQTESQIAAGDIVYWVGEGDDQAILAIDFGTTALAWGYRFDESDGLTVDDMINDIMDADPRAQLSMDWDTYEDCFYYVERPQYDLTCTGFGFKVNGTLADEDDAFDDYDLENGMFVKVSASAAAVWSTAIVPVTVKHMPVDATIDAREVTYWVGEGANSAVIAFNWGSPDTALAWGLHFDGSLTVSQAISAMDSLDSRLTATNSAFSFVDGDVNLAFSSNVTGNVLQFILDGNAQAGWSSTLSDGSFLKVGESAFAEGYDSLPFYGEYYPMGVVWTTPVHPVSAPGVTPTAVDATIAASDIVYWVGEGENQMIFVVNWADTSLAWGYKFATETVSMTTVMDAIKAADSRFNYTMSGAYLGDITFNDGTVSLAITPGNWWEQHINGVQGAGMNETIHNGDLNLWADPAAGVQVGVDTWGFPVYAYPMTIHPVSVPQTDAIREASAVSVSIYPNPASVSFNVVCGGLDNVSDAVLYDMTGRKVYSQAIAGESLTINTSALANGVYMLHIGNTTTKVVVKH